MITILPPNIWNYFIAIYHRRYLQTEYWLWLGDLIQVNAVDVESVDERLSVAVSYLIRRTQEERVDQFSR